MYDPKTGSGYFETKLKYDRSKLNKPLVEGVTGNMEQMDISIDGSDVEVGYFRSCVFNKETKAEVKGNMRKTIKQREIMLKTPNIDLRVAFPCIIINHELVNPIKNYCLQYLHALNFYINRFYTILKYDLNVVASTDS